MNKPVKSIEAFRGEGHQPGFPVMAALFLAVFVVVFGVGWFGVFRGLLPPNLAFWFFVASFPPCVMGVYGLMRWSEAGARADRDVYFEELRLTDLPTLIAAQKSPELDAASRRAITAFLNENHPGWSFPDGGDSSPAAPSSA